MKHLLTLALLATLASCQPAPDSVETAIAAAEADARRDAADAARLDAQAKTYYALGRQAEDSAAILHLQSTHVQATTSDSATLQRFFTGYAQPVRPK